MPVLKDRMRAVWERGEWVTPEVSPTRKVGIPDGLVRFPELSDVPLRSIPLHPTLDKMSYSSSTVSDPCVSRSCSYPSLPDFSVDQPPAKRQCSIAGISIPFDLPSTFQDLASPNTNRGIETCGILLGRPFEGGSYVITTLVIPKQTGTRDTCESLPGSEEQILVYALSNNLVCLGWIHTHPTQSCFLSSVDMHTTLSYQQMLSDAVAIVVAPTDKSLPIGVWRLTSAGLDGIRRCKQRGFHDHDGKEAFSQVANDTNWDTNLRVIVVDYRNSK